MSTATLDRATAAYSSIDTPLGEFFVIEEPTGDVRTMWGPPDNNTLRGMTRSPSLCAHLTDRITRYFNGEDVSFDDIPTPSGGPFFRRCWDACRRIPRGETVSYTELARRAGNADACRAAGQAMRRNPLPVVIPCHRVIGSDGALHGYAGSTDAAAGPLGTKQALLRLEKSV